MLEIFLFAKTASASLSIQPLWWITTLMKRVRKASQAIQLLAKAGMILSLLRAESASRAWDAEISAVIDGRVPWSGVNPEVCDLIGDQ